MMQLMVYIALILFVLLITALILPWVNRSSIDKLTSEVHRLKNHINQLQKQLEAQSKVEQSPTPNGLIPGSQTGIDENDLVSIQDIEEQPIVNTQQSVSVNDTSNTDKSRIERQFGTRLPVWIGGIALALAGFFLVKYSLESGLFELTSGIRVSLGGILGIGLLYLGSWVRSRPGFANGVRIAQALSGAGIAVLYAVSFSATALYHLVPAAVSFAGMAITTFIAVVLSLRHGLPVALLGLMGGFLTPVFIGADAVSVPLLFIYLYLVFLSLIYISKQQQWWWLSITTMLGALAWVFYWLLTHFIPVHSVWLGIFLLMFTASLVWPLRRADQAIQSDRITWYQPQCLLNYIGLTLALVLMGWMASMTGFGAFEWLLFGLLAVASIGLAYYNEKIYGFAPWVAMFVNAFLFLNWQPNDAITYMTTLVIFAALYLGSSYFILWRVRLVLLWAGLFCTTSIIYYFLGYYKANIFYDISHQWLWSGIATGLAAITICVLFQVRTHLRAHLHKEHILALYIVVVTLFISTALVLIVDRQFLAVVFAIELAVVAGLNRLTAIKIFRPLVAVFMLIFLILMSAHLLLLFNQIRMSLTGVTYSLSVSEIISWLHYGVPAMMLLSASYFLRLQADGRLVRSLEMLGVFFIAVTLYYELHALFQVTDQNIVLLAGWIERGIFSNILLILSLFCCKLGHNYRRIALIWSGKLLCAIALFRIGYFDLIMYNPWIYYQQIQGWFLFNTLLLPFGLPLLWLMLINQLLQQHFSVNERRCLFTVMFILLFVLINANVRQLFHGEYFINSGITSDLEIYTYSLVWLTLGIGLLIAGVLKKNKVIRYVSLIVMMLTVGKVFIFDARELEGFYRVFSFLGLGICLLGLSYFYSRFVFDTRNETVENAV